MSKKAKEELEKDDFVGRSKGANMATKTTGGMRRMMKKMTR